MKKQRKIFDLDLFDEPFLFTGLKEISGGSYELNFLSDTDTENNKTKIITDFCKLMNRNDKDSMWGADEDGEIWRIFNATRTHKYYRLELNIIYPVNKTPPTQEEVADLPF